jgi:hypothetical protein
MHFAPLPYLDPGSGSILLQLLIAAFLAVSVAIGASWSKIKSWLGIKSKAKEEGTDDDDDEPESK